MREGEKGGRRVGVGGAAYSGKVAQSKDAQQTGLATGTVANDDELPRGMQSAMWTSEQGKYGAWEQIRL